MRYLVVAALALVVGVVVGGIGPRARARALEAELAEAEECRSGGMGTEIATMLGAGRLDRPARAPEAPLPTPEAEPAPEAPQEDGFHVTMGSGEGSEEGDMSIGAMREALELRRVQSRAALIEDAAPSEAQLADFDAAVEDMNAQLTDLARDLVAEFEGGGEPSRRDAMSFAADALDVLVTAEDRFAASLDDAQLDALADEALDPMSHLDPQLLDLLAELDRGAAE